MRRPGPGAITISPTGSSTCSSIAPRARSEPPCGSTKSSCRGAAGADRLRSRPLFLLVFLHRLARQPERLDPGGHAAVHRHLKEDLADFLAGAAVGERALDVGLELVRPVQGREHSEIDEAAELARQLRPRPQPSPAGLRDQLLHRHAEIVDRLQLPLDVLGPEHFLAHGESLVAQFFRHCSILSLIRAERSGERTVQLADLLDPQPDGIAGFEEAAPSHAHPRGSPREHEIARVERHARRQHRDLLGGIEDQLARVGVLHQLAVHPQLDSELMRIAEVPRRDDPGPERAGTVEALLADPVVMEGRSRRVLVALHRVARRKIVRDGVPGDAAQRPLHRRVFHRPADHGRELDLPVHFLRVRRQFDRCAGADHRAPGSLYEMPGLLAQVLHCRSRLLALRARHLGHVIGVVGARAIDVAGMEHRCEQLRAPERHAFRLALSGGDALCRGGEDAMRLAPVLQRAEDRRPRRLPGEACRVVDLLADENPRARLAAGLKTQQSIAHSSSFFQAKARFMRRIQSSNAIIWSVRNFRVVSSVSFPSANLLAAMPMNTSGFTSQCTPSCERIGRKWYWPREPPTMPVVQLNTAAGLLSNGCGLNRDIQSIAFVSGAPTDQLYSGEANSSASAARISSRSFVAAAGKPFSWTSKL